MAATRSTITSAFLLIAALAVAPACNEDENEFIIGDPVGETIDEGEGRGNALAALSFDELINNDYPVQISITATIIGSIHDSAIVQADFAVQVVSDADIADYANDELIDHDNFNAELDDLTRLYGVGFLPSDVADDLAAEASVTVGLMRSSSDPDFTYVDAQVRQHAAAQIILDQLLDIVGPGDMGDYILDTQDMLSNHLDRSTNLLSTFY